MRNVTYVFLLVLAGLLTYGFGFVEISLSDLDATNVGSKFLTLILIALFIERAVEVFVNLEFRAAQNAINRPVRLAKLALERAEARLDLEVARRVPSDQSEAALTNDLERKSVRIMGAETEVLRAMDRVAKATEEVAGDHQRHTDAKTRFAMMANFSLCLLAALVGFRAFGQFVVPEAMAALAGPQRQVVRIFDVVITTLVLAGGAEGLHQIVKRFLSARTDLLKPRGE